MTPSFIYCAVHVPVNSFDDISSLVPNRTNLLHLICLLVDLRVIRLLQLSPVLLLLDKTAGTLYFFRGPCEAATQSSIPIHSM